MGLGRDKDARGRDKNVTDSEGLYNQGREYFHGSLLSLLLGATAIKACEDGIAEYALRQQPRDQTLFYVQHSTESLSQLARLAWRQSAEETFSQATPFVSVTTQHSGCYQPRHMSPEHPLVTPAFTCLDLPSQRLIAPLPPLLSSATQPWHCPELPSQLNPTARNRRMPPGHHFGTREASHRRNPRPRRLGPSASKYTKRSWLFSFR